MSKTGWEIPSPEATMLHGHDAENLNLGIVTISKLLLKGLIFLFAPGIGFGVW